MIGKLYRKMLLTQILSSMTVMLCMLVDSIMIGRFLGIESMTAYGYAAPVLLVFAAIGSMLSAGVQVVCGRTMGRGDRRGSHACFTASVVIALLVSMVGVAVVMIFTEPICVLLGAGKGSGDSEVFRLTRDYLRGFIIGAPAFIMSQILVPYLQISGRHGRLVAAVVAMTLADIGMDVANVMVFEAGTYGMGLASSVSYYIALVIGIACFFRRDSVFKFRPRLFKASWCGGIFAEGVPTLINQVSIVLLTLIINKLLRRTSGDLAVAAYSVITTVGNICYSFSSGIASVALTLSSLFYGDEDRRSLRTVVRTMCLYSLVICAAVTAAVVTMAAPLVQVFIEDAKAESMAIAGLKLFVLSLVPCSVNASFKSFFQGTGRVGLTMCISVCQNFALTAFSAYILSNYLGVSGIWLAFLSGEILTLLFISAVVFIKRRKVRINAETFSLLPDSFGAGIGFEACIREKRNISGVCARAIGFLYDMSIEHKQAGMIVACIEALSEDIIACAIKSRDPLVIEIRLMIKDGSPVLRVRDNSEGFDPRRYLRRRKTGETESSRLQGIMKNVKRSDYVNSLGLNNLTLSF